MTKSKIQINQSRQNRNWEKDSVFPIFAETLDKRIRPKDTPMGLAQCILRDTKQFIDSQKKYLQSPKELNNLNNVYLSKLECYLASLAYTAERDLQTELLNKKTFIARARDLLDNDLDFCIFVIDLNDLKKINDSFGHNIGDEYIGCIAKTIKVFAQKYRITAGRCGGDEFYLMMPLYPTILDKQKYVEEFVILFQSDFEKCWDLRNYEVSASFALGWVIKSDFEKTELPTIDKLIDLADIKMYKDKMVKKGLK